MHGLDTCISLLTPLLYVPVHRCDNVNIVAQRLIKVLSRCILEELAGVRVHPSPHAGIGFWLEDVSARQAPAGQHRFTLHLLVPGLDTR